MRNITLRDSVTKSKLFGVLIIAGILALSQAACSTVAAKSKSDPNTAKTSPGNASSVQVVTVSMTNFAFIFTPNQISAGVVRFVVKNDAEGMVHEFFLVKTDLPVNKLPVNADGTSIDEESTQFTKLGSVEDIDPGKSGEMTVKLDPGHYVYFCNTTSHYKLGMAGEITIPAVGNATLSPSYPVADSMGMTPTSDTNTPEVITVSMTNFAFKFTPSTIKAGTVKFVVKNDSADVIHELFLVKTDLPVNKMPMNKDGSAINEDSNQFTKLGSVEDVDAGKSGEMTVKLEPGRYVYFCNTPGHYMLGMSGEFTVVQ